MVLELTLLGVNLADISRLQLILAQLGLFLDALLIALGKEDKLLHALHIVLTFLVEVTHVQCFGPYVLVEVHQHVLLQPCLAVIDCNAVVVAVEAVNESLNRGLVEVTQVGRRLAGLLAHNHGLRLDKTERINDDLALH